MSRFRALKRPVKSWLRDRQLEIVVPPSRRPRDLHHVRFRRYHLPPDVASTQHTSARSAMLVDLDRIVNRAGFGYGASGWHPFVAALQEHLADPELPYQQTVLRAFYGRFQPRTVHDLLFDDRAVPRRVLASWPAVEPLIDVWPVTAAQVHDTTRRTAGAELPHSQYRGPTSELFGATHLRRIVETYQSFRREGYRPDRYGYASGYFVTDGRDYRFVLGHGNHRVAALSVLGERRVAVTLREAHPPVIDVRELQRWVTGHGGLLEQAEAHAVFHQLLHGDSVRRARALALA
jgi:hypothetical protein